MDEDEDNILSDSRS